MRLWRFEFGTWHQAGVWRGRVKVLQLTREWTQCGCHIWTLGNMYFTVLSNSCLQHAREEEMNKKLGKWK